jgi:hypothetical protein
MGGVHGGDGKLAGLYGLMHFDEELKTHEQRRKRSARALAAVIRHGFIAISLHDFCRRLHAFAHISCSQVHVGAHDAGQGR